MTFILGGTASGKSAYAESLFNSAKRALYLATFDPTTDDLEMRRRIAVHQARRSAKWRLIEAPLELPRTLQSLAAEEAPPILIDSVSLWLANLNCKNAEQGEAATAELLAAIKTVGGQLVIVADECGMGTIAAERVARNFAEFGGDLNRRLAAAADEVILVVGGLPMAIK